MENNWSEKDFKLASTADPTWEELLNVHFKDEIRSLNANLTHLEIEDGTDDSAAAKVSVPKADPAPSPLAEVMAAAIQKPRLPEGSPPPRVRSLRSPAGSPTNTSAKKAFLQSAKASTTTIDDEDETVPK